jgi:bifunctional non-homologous end joining protein LigD
MDREAPADAAWRPPMLAQAARFPASLAGVNPAEWSFERKLDGLRCIAVRNGPDVELWSRNHLSWCHRFPAVASSVASLGIDNLALDGEIVAFDGSRTSFGLLQNARPDTPVVYCAFDVLHLLGRDTTLLPQVERASLLDVALARSPRVRPVERVDGDPADLLDAACRNGWEGLIAKRKSSPYRSGRSADWRKLKCSTRQELVVGGWTDSSGARPGFGALLLGYYEPGGRFRYAGRVGSGFAESELRHLSETLKPLRSDESPFDEPVPERGVHFVTPALVVEVELGEWTAGGMLRHPRYLGVRPGRAAADVRRE